MRQVLAIAICIAAALPVEAQEPLPPSTSLSFYGVPGLIDMPSAEVMTDGELALTVSSFAGTTRGTLSFQFAPRITGSFRYTELRNYNSGGFGTFYDRSFDLRFQLLKESARFPSVVIALQDFVGTGIYSAEYLAFSKTIDQRVTLTGGFGWGRLGSDGTIGSTGSRPDRDPDLGGEPEPEVWFRGDVGVFGGIAWQATPSLMLKAEVSSDAYEREDDELGIFNRRSPFNFGAEYRLSEDVRLGAYWLYGTELGVMLQVSVNPGRPPQEAIRDDAPPPVLVRPSRAERPEFYTTDWLQSETERDAIETALVEGLRDESMQMEALRLTGDTAVLYLRNRGYRATAQAQGRTVRVMARALPSSIERFTIIQTVRGLQLPAITWLRSDVERYAVAPDGAEQMLARAQVDTDPPAPERFEFAPDAFPRNRLSVAPFLQVSAFDPDNPLRADFGIQANARYEPAPGWLFNTNARAGIIGNLDENERDSNSELPRVRSDFAEYDRNGDPWIENLYGAYYAQPGEEIYSRLTVGYLERMFAGVSGELLWSPYERRYAFGAELNYVRQRDFEGGFGFQDYDVLTGHASLYWRVLDQYEARIDVGRYLAGDYGTTLALSRVFQNGWAVGAYATFTDVSAEEFGEGSFDKGIGVSVPIEWLTGRSTRQTASVRFSPVTRDGGARLNVPGRLFGLVNRGSQYRQEEQWGRFWR